MVVSIALRGYGPLTVACARTTLGAAALMGLGIADLTSDPAVLLSTLTTLLKTQSDQAQITAEVASRLAGRAA